MNSDEASLYFEECTQGEGTHFECKLNAAHKLNRGEYLYRVKTTFTPTQEEESCTACEQISDTLKFFTICGPETVSCSSTCQWRIEDELVTPHDNQHSTYTIPTAPLMTEACRGLDTYHLYTDSTGT